MYRILFYYRRKATTSRPFSCVTFKKYSTPGWLKFKLISYPPFELLKAFKRKTNMVEISLFFHHKKSKEEKTYTPFRGRCPHLLTVFEVCALNT